MTPYLRLKALRADLRHHQMLNRLALADYSAGVRKVKEIAAEMRTLQSVIHSQKARSRRA